MHSRSLIRTEHLISKPHNKMVNLTVCYQAQCHSNISNTVLSEKTTSCMAAEVVWASTDLNTCRNIFFANYSSLQEGTSEEMLRYYSAAPPSVCCQYVTFLHFHLTLSMMFFFTFIPWKHLIMMEKYGGIAYNCVMTL